MKNYDYEITGIKIDFNSLETEKIAVNGSFKLKDDEYPSMNYNALKLKYNNLVMQESHQQVWFLKNGRIVYLFDKNTCYIKETK